MLHVRDLQVSFGPHEILKHISFDLNPGEALAITGPNGSGKTTLLKCITGSLSPSAGSIQLKKDIAFSLLPQERPESNQTIIEFLLSKFPKVQKTYQKMSQSHPESSDYADAIAEYTEYGGYELEAELKGHAFAFGFTEDDLLRKMESFSEGQKQIWAIIQLFLTKAELLIMDEPLNHLDLSMRLYLEEAIRREKKRGRAFLIVSHDRIFIDRIADRTLYLQRGEGILDHGGYSTLLEHLERDFQSRKEHAEEIQRKIEKLEQEARRLKVWAARKEKENVGGYDNVTKRAARLAKRAISAQHRKEKMIEKLKEEKPFVEKRINLSFPPYSVSNRRLVSAESISKRFGEHLVFQNVDLELTTQDRMAVIGPNGSGKTTLMRCLLGQLQADAGRVYRNDHVNWIHLPQDIRGYFQKEILLDNLMVYGVEESTVRQFLGAAKLRREKVLQSISTLSHGELMRSAIVSAILAKAEFLFLDEPTSHLDIESLEVLDQLLAEFPGGMLFISHDRQFIAKNAEEVFSIRGKTLVRSYL
jgi:ATP-binding cassette subfamily F protein 3